MVIQFRVTVDVSAVRCETIKKPLIQSIQKPGWNVLNLFMGSPKKCWNFGWLWPPGGVYLSKPPGRLRVELVEFPQNLSGSSWRCFSCAGKQENIGWPGVSHIFMLGSNCWCFSNRNALGLWDFFVIWVTWPAKTSEKNHRKYQNQQKWWCTRYTLAGLPSSPHSPSGFFPGKIQSPKFSGSEIMVKSRWSRIVTMAGNSPQPLDCWDWEIINMAYISWENHRKYPWGIDNFAIFDYWVNGNGYLYHFFKATKRWIKLSLTS